MLRSRSFSSNVNLFLADVKSSKIIFREKIRQREKKKTYSHLSTELLIFRFSSSWKLKFIPESCDEASRGSIVLIFDMAPV